jgi:hypothetical protein
VLSIEAFTTWKPHGSTREVVDRANEIIDEFLLQGFRLTLRQLFYQFVARAVLENSHRAYKRLGRTICDGRNAGLIDWDAIEDRTRTVNMHVAWKGPADRIRSAANSYVEDPWLRQRYRPEVWIEKDALLGVIEDVCSDLRVPYFAHRGNNSQTLQYRAGKRFADYIDQGLIPVVLNLTDHDPNGIDMHRDNVERLARYAGQEIEVRRIALTLDQARELPTNPVKEKDSRTAKYRREFGTSDCWELDALSPTAIADLIRTEIRDMIDPNAWQSSLHREERYRKLLANVAENWTKVRKSAGSTQKNSIRRS